MTTKKPTAAEQAAAEAEAEEAAAAAEQQAADARIEAEKKLADRPAEEFLDDPYPPQIDPNSPPVIDQIDPNLPADAGKKDPVSPAVTMGPATTMDDLGIAANEPYPTGNPPQPTHAEINGLVTPAGVVAPHGPVPTEAQRRGG